MLVILLRVYMCLSLTIGLKSRIQLKSNFVILSATCCAVVRGCVKSWVKIPPVFGVFGEYCFYKWVGLLLGKDASR